MSKMAIALVLTKSCANIGVSARGFANSSQQGLHSAEGAHPHKTCVSLSSYNTVEFLNGV
jgi:hypothetical protein